MTATEILAALWTDCYCTEAVAALDALKRTLRGHGRSFGVRGYPPGETEAVELAVEPMEVCCPLCRNTRRMLTPDGRAVLDQLRVELVKAKEQPLPF